jgi:hypothetical protein
MKPGGQKRVRVDYADHSEAFARVLPRSGTLVRQCSDVHGHADWFLLKLDEPFDYQLKVELVDVFLASGDFWTLWRRVAGPSADAIVVADMSGPEQQLFDSLYEVVYMGQPDRATPSEHAAGLRGGSDLRTLVEAWRSDASRVSA